MQVIDRELREKKLERTKSCRSRRINTWLYEARTVRIDGGISVEEAGSSAYYKRKGLGLITRVAIATERPLLSAETECIEKWTRG